MHVKFPKKYIFYSFFSSHFFTTTNRLFALLKPPAKGGGELFFVDGPDKPFQCLLEAVLGQSEVSLVLHFWEEEEVPGERIGRTLAHSEAF